MRDIRLTYSDHEVFNTMLDAEHYNFIRTHIEALKRMWNEQGKSFWLKHLTMYRHYCYNTGTVYCLTKDGSNPSQHCLQNISVLADQIFIVIHNEFINCSFGTAKSFLTDLATLISNRNLLVACRNTSICNNPFYSGETRDAFRKFIGHCKSFPPGIRDFYFLGLAFPIFGIYGGSICLLLKMWLQSSEICVPLERYLKACWKIPPELKTNSFSPTSFHRHLLEKHGSSVDQMLMDGCFGLFSSNRTGPEEMISDEKKKNCCSYKSDCIDSTHRQYELFIDFICQRQQFPSDKFSAEELKEDFENYLEEKAEDFEIEEERRLKILKLAEKKFQKELELENIKSKREETSKSKSPPKTTTTNVSDTTKTIKSCNTPNSFLQSKAKQHLDFSSSSESVDATTTERNNAADRKDSENIKTPVKNVSNNLVQPRKYSDSSSNSVHGRTPSPTISTSSNTVTPKGKKAKKNKKSNINSTAKEAKPAPKEVKEAPKEVKPAPKEVKPAPKELKAAHKEIKAESMEVKVAPKEVKPAPKEIKAASKDVKSAPKEVKPAPKEVKPAPKEVKPAPKEVKPAPKEVKPAPKEVKPAPKEVKSEPKGGNPTPKDVKPAPYEVKQEAKKSKPEGKDIEIVKTPNKTVNKGERGFVKLEPGSLEADFEESIPDEWFNDHPPDLIAFKKRLMTCTLLDIAENTTSTDRFEKLFNYKSKAVMVKATVKVSKDGKPTRSIQEVKVFASDSPSKPDTITEKSQKVATSKPNSELKTEVKNPQAIKNTTKISPQKNNTTEKNLTQKSLGTTKGSATELKEISKNLDTLDKTIQEQNGLGLDGFRLLVETGSLLMSGKSSASSSKDALKSCVNCRKTETKPKSFKKCGRCKAENVKYINYYCSRECQVEDWTNSHQEEHEKGLIKNV